MLKLIGSVMVLGSCAALGLNARQNLRRRVAAIDALTLAMELMRSEILCHRSPIPEIVDQLAQSENAIIRTLFTSLQQKLRQENGLSLGYLWRQNLREHRDKLGMGRAACETACAAAEYLGRYDAQEQADGLKRIATRLTAERQAAQSELQEKGNLYRTCGIAVGLLTILALI